MTNSREIRLTSRPNGLPTAANFELHSTTLPDPAGGEVQVRNRWMSVDPFMRLRMNDMPGGPPPFQLGHALDGDAIGEVIASNDPSLVVGDLVQSGFGWREAFNAPASAVRRLDPGSLPPQAFLGVAGMPGLTAYAGLQRVADLRDGDVVFVSGAAGTVGSLVCQMAKARGHMVIGSAGGARKGAYLKEIGVDRCIDYKAEEGLTGALLAAAPDGIDVYFDNVGGEHLEAAITAGRPSARIVLCGAISMYNRMTPPVGPRNPILMIAKQMRMEGVTGFAQMHLMADFQRDLAQWVQGGKVTWKETVFEGIEKAPEAFLGLFEGENIGKMLVKLA